MYWAALCATNHKVTNFCCWWKMQFFPNLAPHSSTCNCLLIFLKPFVVFLSCNCLYCGCVETLQPAWPTSPKHRKQEVKVLQWLKVSIPALQIHDLHYLYLLYHCLHRVVLIYLPPTFLWRCGCIAIWGWFNDLQLISISTTNTIQMQRKH